MLTMTNIQSGDSSARVSDGSSNQSINAASTSSPKDAAVPFGQLVKAPKQHDQSVVDDPLLTNEADNADESAVHATLATLITEPELPQGSAVATSQTPATSLQQQASELLSQFVVNANTRHSAAPQVEAHVAHPSIAIGKENSPRSSVNSALLVTQAAPDNTISRPINAEIANSLTNLSSQPVTAQQTQGHQTTPAPVSTTPSTTEWAPVRVDTQAGKWGEQMLQVLNDRVTLQAQQNLQEARIRLDPPDLGKLDLMVRVEGDRLSVQINANAAATREALMQVSERLRFELQNQNFMHVDVQVGTGEGQHESPQHSQEEESTVLASRRFDDDSSFQSTFTTAEHWLSTQA
ncbi:flagellar hook-length control protein FliK [Vibrio mediterranei]|nr:MULTISPECIES: flagellar hook-length control protein FliK [Vibrio]